GDQIWIVIIDNDENIDCDVRDKIWTDLKVFDPKTGAYIVWVSYETDEGIWDGTDWVTYENVNYEPYKGHSPGNSAGWLSSDYLEETGADTGVFVSSRAFQVGARLGREPQENTHVVDNAIRGSEPAEGFPYDFQGGHFLYTGNEFGDQIPGERGFFFGNAEEDWYSLLGVSYSDLDAFLPGAFPDPEGEEATYLIGRFENMDTLVGLYQDQNDPTDVALGLLKIIDTEATITWDQEIYKDANGSASITVVDPDENLNCNLVEYVPVFIIVNPGSWNPVNKDPDTAAEWNGTGATGSGWPSPNSFCTLKATGGVIPDALNDTDPAVLLIEPIRWYNW
ncbi:hypothetical protein KAH43_04290, partial [Candidatus Bipolaricaulota bacterium]|nr:hypothetical protein [Candidatus Bipolaricaulota bacterium]